MRLAVMMVHLLRASHRMRSILLMLCIFCTILFLRLGQCQINSHLRIASYSNPLGNLPNVSINKIGIIESQLIVMLAEELNFTYEVHAPTDVLQIGSIDETKGNGSWTGVMGQLVRNEVDMSISFGPWFYSRFTAVDMTVTIIIDDISIMIPYPKQNTNAAAYLYAFSFLTWGLIFISFMMSALLLWLIAYVEQDGERDLTMIFVFITSVGTGQGGYLRQFSLPSRIVQGSFLFVLLVISYSFTGIVTSMITTPKYEFLVRSIEDVANNEEILPLIIKESSTHITFEESTNPIFKKIFDRIQANPKLLVSSTSEFMEILLSNPQHVFLLSNILADSEIEKDFKRTRICRATVLPKYVRERTNGLFLRKNSIYTAIVNKQLLLLRQAGFANYMDSTDKSFASRCYIDESKKTSKKRGSLSSPLSLYDLRGIFIAFGYLFIACFATFLFELVFYLFQSCCC